ncbi:hypothetical protein GCM10010510_67280 [Streptomyces anandii JCM 4720]|nr:hypothetical protein GCM10010510_67280 [Streptomyces anandii JCM 4720]
MYGATKTSPGAVPGRRVVTVTRMGCRFGADTKLHTPLPEVIGGGTLVAGGAGWVAH